MRCQFCEKEYRTNVSLVQHQIRCKSNSNRIECKSGFKGKTHSDDVRKYLSEVSTDLHKSGILKPPPSFAGKTHSDKTKKKISSSMNGNRNANHRGDRQSYYNGIRMDSRWEVGTAKYFDDNNIVWKYNEKGYKLSNGSYYYPDFFIYEDDKFVKIVEVKGYFRENNRKKYEMFLSEYPDICIELWQRPKLYELQIIDREGYIIHGG